MANCADAADAAGAVGTAAAHSPEKSAEELCSAADYVPASYADVVAAAVLCWPYCCQQH